MIGFALRNQGRSGVLAGIYAISGNSSYNPLYEIHHGILLLTCPGLVTGLNSLRSIRIITAFQILAAK
jgi:hypothetical protein